MALAFFDLEVSNDMKRKMVSKIEEVEEEGEEEETEKETDDELDTEDEEESTEGSEVESGSEDGDYDEDDVEAEVRTEIRFNKKVDLNYKDVNEEFLSKELSDFVTVNTKHFLRRFNLSHEFMKLAPETWSQREDYQQALKIVEKLHVVNDTAERGVKMMEKYNKVLCRNEDEKQDLILAIKLYLERFPSSLKSVQLNTMNVT